MHWILAPFLLCLSCSSRRIANEMGTHVGTGYRWCWRLRHAALSYEMDRQLEGTGQDRRKKIVGHKPRGRRKKREPGHGHDNKVRVFRGMSKTNLPGYEGFFQFRRNVHQLTAFEQAELILYAALDPTVASKARLTVRSKAVQPRG